MAENETKTKNPNDIGALWIGVDSSTGEKRFYGRLEINGESIFFKMYKNKFKEPGSKQPDYRLYRQSDSTSAPKTTTAPASTTAPSEPANEQPTRKTARKQPVETQAPVAPEEQTL